MEAFYANSNPQVDNGLSAPTYIHDQKFASYSESPIIHANNMMMYLNPTSSTGSFSEISHGTSMPTHNTCVEIPTMTGRSEMMFIPPTDNIQDLQLASRSQHSLIEGEQNLHGLSLSLSTQMSTALPQASFQNQFSNNGLSPVSKDLANSGYGSYDLIGFGGPNNLQYSLNQKAVGFSGYQYEQAGFANVVLKSKYLKPAQLLLDEIVNVKEALVKHESRKEQNVNRDEEESADSKDKGSADLDGNGSASASQDISVNERQELQNRLDKLLAMFDEVDRRYKQYYHQMQILVSSFDMVAGCGAAKPYTALALKTISRHFRSLKDSINGQIQAARKGLGEQDTGPGGVIPRLRYVDQQLRQQRALQQFGMMRHAWRPQRGLPENAVTVLRAWLFEHFLHPYPKDSEKIMLARQTGLTRGQVANWFINARVRLWKPMVEEMYKEEFGGADLNSKSPPENAPRPGASEDRRESLQENLASMAESGHLGPSHEKTNNTLNYHSIENSELLGHGFYPHDHNSLMGYQVPELGNYAIDNNGNNNNNNKVSLALGLRRVEGDTSNGSTFRPGGSTENHAIGNGSAEFSYIESVNQQHRFDNSHLLNDFVA